MDMEYFVKRCLRESWDEEEIVDRLTSIIEYYKGIGVENSRKLSQAVFDEVVVTESLARTDLLTYPKTGIHMGEFGVGSRGQEISMFTVKLPKLLEILVLILLLIQLLRMMVV